MKYQNTLQEATKSQFIEIGSYSGNELMFTARRPTSKVGNQVVTFAKGSVTLRMPHEIVSCADKACVLGTVMESLSIDFNIVDVDSIDVLKAEVDRVFALVKTQMVHGILPPLYSDFISQ